MKKIPAALLLLSMISCNNQSDNSKENKVSEKTGAAENTATGNCGTLILFKKGAVIEGTSYDATGKQTSTQTTTVTDVTNEGGMLVAKSSSVMNISTGQKTMNLVYKCDGQNLYMDVNSMLQNFSALQHLKGDIKPIQFPINISVGQTLPEASYTVSMDRGAVKMDITASYKNRKVESKEMITTAAGSWNCYKVSSDIESNVDGIDEKTKKIMEAVKDKMKMGMIMWYTPELGIVRTEMYQNGKLNSRSEITGIKN